MKSNHLYKKSERTPWFVTNPPVLKFPSRPNSSRSDGLFCSHPRLRRGLLPTFRIQKFQSAEREGFEPSRIFRLCRFSKPVLSTTQPPLRGDKRRDYTTNTPCWLYFFTKNATLALFARPYRLMVRTAAFQAVNPGSIPGRVTGLDSLQKPPAKVAFCLPNPAVTLQQSVCTLCVGN